MKENFLNNCVEKLLNNNKILNNFDDFHDIIVDQILKHQLVNIG